MQIEPVCFFYILNCRVEWGNEKNRLISKEFIKLKLLAGIHNLTLFKASIIIELYEKAVFTQSFCLYALDQ